MSSYEGFGLAFLEEYQRKRGQDAVKVTSGPPLSMTVTNPQSETDTPYAENNPNRLSETEQSKKAINPADANDELQPSTNPCEDNELSEDMINPGRGNETHDELINPLALDDESSLLINPEGANEESQPLITPPNENETQPSTSPLKDNEQSVNVINPSATNEKAKQQLQQALNPKKRNKNNAISTTIDGIRFASKWEAEVYLQQKARVLSGEIAMLLLQVPIILPGMTETGKQRNKMSIDFLAIKDLDAVEFIDAKGKTERDWHLRKCMAENEYGITIQVVKRSR